VAEAAKVIEHNAISTSPCQWISQDI
jgi:hypothetical protein